MSDKRSGKGCWYFTYIEECAICGITTTERERQSGLKPDRAIDRVEYRQTACQRHFL